MKKVILIWIGMVLLLIDTRIAGVINYPGYIPFDTPAPDTVDMVIGHLIGDAAPFDLFSDAVGLLLILFVTCKIVNENERAFRGFLLSLASLVLYAANWFMPFFLNGEKRYAAGYLLFMAYKLVKCVTIIQAGLVCCQMAESMENHAWNNVVAIFVILAAATGFIRGLCYFYEMTGTFYIYYAAEIFFTVVFTVMYWKHRSFVQIGQQ